jgi:hypothetical protein
LTLRAAASLSSRLSASSAVTRPARRRATVRPPGFGSNGRGRGVEGHPELGATREFKLDVDVPLLVLGDTLHQPVPVRPGFVLQAVCGENAEEWSG